jgi:hypothetical protein
MIMEYYIVASNWNTILKKKITFKLVARSLGCDFKES